MVKKKVRIQVTLEHKCEKGIYRYVTYKNRNTKIVMAGNSSEWEHLKTSWHKFVEQVPPNWEIILLLKAIKWTFTSRIPRIYCGIVLIGSVILAPCCEIKEVFFGDNGAANWKNFKYNLKCDAIEAKKNFNSAWKQIPDRKLVSAFLKQAGITYSCYDEEAPWL